MTWLLRARTARVSASPEVITRASESLTTPTSLIITSFNPLFQTFAEAGFGSGDPDTQRLIHQARRIERSVRWKRTHTQEASGMRLIGTNPAIAACVSACYPGRRRSRHAVSGRR